MTNHDIPRSAIDALFASNLLLPRLASAVRLYLHLARLAAPWGTIIRSRKRLSDDIGVSEHAIDRWVKRLAEAKLIRVQVPSPFFVIRMHFWSGNKVISVEKSTSAGPKASDIDNARGSSSKLQEQAAALKGSGDGGPGEGAALIPEVRAVLGDTDAAEVAELLDQYPAHAVRKALNRVRLTPQSQIRKSKAALFRYLLVKFTE